MSAAIAASIATPLGATDEPQASLACERYRAQLHAKLALIDRRTVLLGSMSLDQRSATTNTEMVMRIRSPELARQILSWFNSTDRADVRGSYQVRLGPDGRSLQRVALLGEGRSETLHEDAEFNFRERLRLWLISLFVPEALL